MKVLFLHPNTPDYLSSGLFHGLRTLLGKNCVDLPRFDAMYKPLTDGMRNKIRGKGFTLYGLLDDIPELAEDRFFIWYKNIQDFDLYIVADIWHHYDVYNQLRKIVAPEKIIVVDPADMTRVFPFNNNRLLFRKEWSRLFIPFDKKTRYYKRELSSNKSELSGTPAALDFIIKSFIPPVILPIHFSIPVEKISMVTPANKTKLFTENIVDEAVSRHITASHFIPLGKQQYSFETEAAYFEDIRQSKFGITVKRSGWDCLRHYEFAANGAVLCFKELDKKPRLNAPEGLNKSNCIVYQDYDDLMNQINSLNDSTYANLLSNSYNWIYENTTIALASRLLKDHCQ